MSGSSRLQDSTDNSCREIWVRPQQAPTFGIAIHFSGVTRRALLTELTSSVLLTEPSKIVGRSSRRYVVVQIASNNTVINEEKSKMADIATVGQGLERNHEQQTPCGVEQWIVLLLYSIFTGTSYGGG